MVPMLGFDKCCISTGAAATSAVDSAYSKLDPSPEAPPTSVPLLAVARLSWASALLGNSDTATTLAKRVLMGKQPRARAWAELTLAHLGLQSALPKFHGGATRMTRGEAKRICAVLDDLEQCIQGFFGVGDVPGLHACCRSASPVLAVDYPFNAP